MGKNKDEIKYILSSDFRVVNEWFYENFMLLNPFRINDFLVILPKQIKRLKSHFICLGNDMNCTENLNFNYLALKIVKKWKF